MVCDYENHQGKIILVDDDIDIVIQLFFLILKNKLGLIHNVTTAINIATPISIEITKAFTQLTTF